MFDHRKLLIFAGATRRVETNSETFDRLDEFAMIKIQMLKTHCEYVEEVFVDKVRDELIDLLGSSLFLWSRTSAFQRVEQKKKKKGAKKYNYNPKALTSRALQDGFHFLKVAGELFVHLRGHFLLRQDFLQ